MNAEKAAGNTAAGDGVREEDNRGEKNQRTTTRRDLVIVNSEQFGYHMDTYYYCKLLRQRYRVHYVGWDHNLPKMTLDGVNAVYVTREGTLGRILRLLKAIEDCQPAGVEPRKTVIFVKYVKLISIFLRFKFRRHPLILDIRTGSVATNPLQRFGADLLLRIEAALYDNVTVITKGLAAKLGLADRSKILPLGAEPIAQVDNKFDGIRLLYVGTLLNRDLDKAVRGFAAYISSQTDEISSQQQNAHFTIIGSGPGQEQQELESLCSALGIQDRVSILGRIPHDRLAEHYTLHNVGLSFVPMTSYYDVQPSTKTFEYLLSGMPVIATATQEHKAVVSPDNGVLIEDSERGMCDGLQQMQRRLVEFQSDAIQAGAQQHRWSKITSDLADYLDGLVDNPAAE